jgi:hypothetical protein
MASSNTNPGSAVKASAPDRGDSRERRRAPTHVHQLAASRPARRRVPSASRGGVRATPTRKDIMFRSWILGAVFLFSCAVEPVATDEPAAEAEVASELTIPAELTPTGGGARTLEACSPPGTSRLCCPFPLGCSCRGVQTCSETGEWGTCDGAGRKGQPCP